MSVYKAKIYLSEVKVNHTNEKWPVQLELVSFKVNHMDKDRHR